MIGEELGFIGVCVVIGLYTALVGRALWIGLKCVEMRRHFAGYVAFGIALMIGLQALVSMGVNLGLLPTKGLTLPLISSGGSSVMMTCVAIGLLLRVSYELDRAQRQVVRLRGEGAQPAPGNIRRRRNRAGAGFRRTRHQSPAPAHRADVRQREAGMIRRLLETSARPRKTRQAFSRVHFVGIAAPA